MSDLRERITQKMRDMGFDADEQIAILALFDEERLELVAADRAGGCPSCGLTAERFHELLEAEARCAKLVEALERIAELHDGGLAYCIAPCTTCDIVAAALAAEKEQT